MSKAEELARKYCEGSSFSDACMEKPAYIAGYRQAEKDLEIAREEVIEEAVKWLKENAKSYIYWMDEEFGEEDLVKDFRKYMEDKVC